MAFIILIPAGLACTPGCKDRAGSLLLEDLKDRIQGRLSCEDIRIRQYTSLKPQMDSMVAVKERRVQVKGHDHE